MSPPSDAFQPRSGNLNQLRSDKTCNYAPISQLRTKVRTYPAAFHGQIEAQKTLNRRRRYFINTLPANHPLRARTAKRGGLLLTSPPPLPPLPPSPSHPLSLPSPPIPRAVDEQTQPSPIGVLTSTFTPVTTVDSEQPPASSQPSSLFALPPFTSSPFTSSLPFTSLSPFTISSPPLAPSQPIPSQEQVQSMTRQKFNKKTITRDEAHKTSSSNSNSSSSNAGAGGISDSESSNGSSSSSGNGSGNGNGNGNGSSRNRGSATFYIDRARLRNMWKTTDLNTNQEREKNQVRWKMKQESDKMRIDRTFCG